MCKEKKATAVFGHIANDLTTEYWDRTGWKWHQVPVETCIASLVEMLNGQGIYTLASCCGHGGLGGIPILEEDVKKARGLGFEVDIGPDGWPWAIIPSRTLT